MYRALDLLASDKTALALTFPQIATTATVPTPVEISTFFNRQIEQNEEQKKAVSQNHTNFNSSIVLLLLIEDRNEIVI